ncbi:MAG: hypothetical protein WDM71_06945 [Ferruginibacter sp.]
MKIKLLQRILFLSIVILSFSCKKNSNDTPSFYLKFNENGKWITFTKTAGEIGVDPVHTGNKELNIAGISNDSTQSLNFSIQIIGYTGIFPLGNFSSNDSSFNIITMDHIVKHDSTVNDYGISNADSTAPSGYTFIITSIDSLQIRGTFSGNYLYNPSDSINKIDPITQGEFSISRIR